MSISKPFNTLPHEMVDHIFSFLDVKSLRRCREVDTRFRVIAETFLRFHIDSTEELVKKFELILMQAPDDKVTMINVSFNSSLVPFSYPFLQVRYWPPFVHKFDNDTLHVVSLGTTPEYSRKVSPILIHNMGTINLCENGFWNQFKRTLANITGNGARVHLDARLSTQAFIKLIDDISVIHTKIQTGKLARTLQIIAKATAVTALTALSSYAMFFY